MNKWSIFFFSNYFLLFRSRLHFCCFDALTWLSWNNGPTCDCYHLAFYKVNIIVLLLFAFLKKSYIRRYTCCNTNLSERFKIGYFCLRILKEKIIWDPQTHALFYKPALKREITLWNKNWVTGRIIEQNRLISCRCGHSWLVSWRSVVSQKN